MFWSKGPPEDREGDEFAPPIVPTASQEIVFVDDEYVPSDEDRLASCRGSMFMVTGEALAMAQTAARLARTTEIFWFWLADKNNRYVVTSIYIPRMNGSAAFVSVSAEQIIEAAREARRRGLVIVGAGHTHLGIVFSSRTDINEMATLSTERAGLISRRRESFEGEVQPVSTDGTGGDAAASPGALSVLFPEFPELSLELVVPGNMLQEADKIRARLIHERRRIVTSFTTHSASAKPNTHVPRHVRETCSLCGQSVQGIMPPRDVTIVVIGECRITLDAEDELARELDEKVLPGVYSYGASTGSGYNNTYTPVATAAPVQETVTADDAAPTTYEIRKRGKVIAAEIPGWIIEKACAATPEFSDALFPPDDPEPEPAEADVGARGSSA